jgi:hypothetical protein
MAMATLLYADDIAAQAATRLLTPGKSAPLLFSPAWSQANA